MSDHHLPTGSGRDPQLPVVGEDAEDDRNVTNLRPPHVPATMAPDENRADDSDEIDLLAY